jgi:hypothetical protein
MKSRASSACADEAARSASRTLGTRCVQLDFEEGRPKPTYGPAVPLSRPELVPGLELELRFASS